MWSVVTVFVKYRVFQDRFVKALRRKQINRIASANTSLEEEFLDEWNTRFHVPARSPSHLHRPVPRAVMRDHVRCYPAPRVVQNDWTVSWCHRIFPWDVAHQKRALARHKILVSELLDGTLRLTGKGRPRSWTEVCTRPSKAKAKRKPAATTKARPQPSGTKKVTFLSGPTL